jgi:hypothetical protein
MREIDSSKFIIIDFVVPALTQCLNLIEPALQLSEDVSSFEIYGIYTSITGKEGHINTLNSAGDWKESSGTLNCISVSMDISP